MASADEIAQQRANEAAAALAACGMDVDTLTGFTPFGRFDEGILVETGWSTGTSEMGPVQYRALYRVDGAHITGEWRSVAARAYADAAEMRLIRVGTCRVCGCTDLDCSGCIERTGKPCSWVEADLCSACVEQGEGDGRG